VTITDVGGSSTSTTSTITVTDGQAPRGSHLPGGPRGYSLRAGDVLFGDPLGGLPAGREWSHGGLSGPVGSAVSQGDQSLSAAPDLADQRAAWLAGPAVARTPREGQASDAFWTASRQLSWDGSADPDGWAAL
jgi:hypothetical protein